MKEITNLTTFQLVEQGSVSLTLHMEWKYRTSKIVQDMVVYANNRRIDFKTYVDFHEQHQLLKAAFPVDIRSTYATYDVQYGNVKRPNHWNTSWDQARFESVAHRYVDLAERNYGVSLLNDCKYGHDVKEHVMRITLLKSATHPDYAQDQGEHQFIYALLPHGGDFIEAKVVEEAYRLNDPMKVVSGHIELPFEQFIDFEGAHVELDAVKKSEDGQYVVVRFHEYAGETNVVVVRTGFDYISYQEGDLRERPIIRAGIQNIIPWEELGFNVVHCASDGKEALELWEKEHVDLVVTDISMPEKTGLELLEEIRKQDKRVRFLILTGYDEFYYAKTAIRLDVEDYILKPINEEELQESIQKSREKLDYKTSIFQYLKGKMELEESHIQQWKLTEWKQSPLILSRISWEGKEEKGRELFHFLKETYCYDSIRFYYEGDGEIIAIRKAGYEQEREVEYFQAIQNQIEQDSSIHTFFAVSSIEYGIHSLIKLYEIAGKLKKY